MHKISCEVVIILTNQKTLRFTKNIHPSEYLSFHLRQKYEGFFLISFNVEVSSDQRSIEIVS